MFNILPSDIIIYFWNFISNNKDTISFLISSKYIYEIGKQYGYLKYLTNGKYLNNGDDKIHNFIKNCLKHKISLFYLKIYNVKDPNIWIPIKWPKKISLINCLSSNYILNPYEETDTEELYIYNFDRHMYKPTKNVKINWSKFPKLKKLYIDSHSIDLSTLNVCSKLEQIIIDMNIQQQLNFSIKDFSNIKSLISNCCFFDDHNTNTTLQNISIYSVN